MLFIIPSLVIKNGLCMRAISGLKDYKYSHDPVEISRLWRLENAKALHVTDLDGVEAGHSVNLDVVKKIVSNVDIPVILGGGIRSVEDAKEAIDAGVYRVVIGTVFIENPDEAIRILNMFGDRKVAIGINAENFHVRIKGGKEDSYLTPISTVINAKVSGFKRVIYTDVLEDQTGRHPRFDAIRLLAEKSGMHVTVSGGIQGLNDLMRLQELESVGVDSVVIGRALYENKFSCQGLWRLCEAGNYPFTAKV
jgi:phosphoribosylformimino-5-aminoimidazole carboxamide ribotide isomerase